MANTMTKYKAEKLLGLTGTYDYKTFSKAYRDAVKVSHPDMGGSEEKMIELNAAKEYLDSFFDDKSATVTCSATEFGADDKVYTERNATSGSSNPMDDFINMVYEQLWKKDAPFYDGDDYTKKPQNEWTDAEWTAFRNFQPPIAWDTDAYTEQKTTKSWGAPDDGNMAPADNIDVTYWKDADWYFYWFTNARFPRDDEQVYVLNENVHYYGPYAVRDRAKHAGNYWQKYVAYHKGEGKFVETPYGVVDASSFEREEWNGNVGVPFAYAYCEHYPSWLEMNLAAQKVSKPIGPWIAETWGWTGEGEDIAFGSDKSAPVAEGGFKIDIDDSWKEGSKFDAGNAVAGAVVGDSCKQFDINGAPGWYNVLNKVVNHFPSRILFWVIAGIWANTLLMAGPSGEEYITLMILALLTLVNIVFPLFAPVRGIMRAALNGALKAWARGKGVKIDWDNVA